MSNVASLSEARETRNREVVDVFVAAMTAVLDVSVDMDVEDGDSGLNGAPFDQALCMQLILGNALILRPSLATSEADKRAALPIIRLLKQCFALRKQAAND